MPQSTVVYVGLFEDAGPAQEPRGQEGIAHLLEHLGFTSSRLYPGGGLQSALALHATYANGATTRVSTSYTSVCLPASLPEVLRLEADRFEHPEPTTAEIERERGVVREEIAYRGRLSPVADLREAVFCSSYPGHFFARAIGGTDSSIARITAADLSAFHAANVMPARSALVIIGDVDSTLAMTLVRSAFGGIQNPDPVPAPTIAELPPRTDATVVLDRYDMEGLAVLCGFRFPSRTARERALGMIARHLLDVGGVGTMLSPGNPESFLSMWTQSEYSKRLPGMPYHFDPDADGKSAYEWLRRSVSARLDTIYTQPYFNAIRAEAGDAVRAHLADPNWLLEQLGESLLRDARLDWLHELEPAVRSVSLDEARAFVNRSLGGKTVSGVVHGRDSRRARKFPRTRRLGGDTAIQAGDAVSDLDSAQVQAALQRYASARHQRAERLVLKNGIPVTYINTPGSPTVHIGGLRTFAYLEHERHGSKPGLCILYNRVVRYGYDDNPEAAALRRDAQFTATPYSYRFSAQGPAAVLPDVAGVLTRRFENRTFRVAGWRAVLARAPELLAGDYLTAGTLAQYRRWRKILGEEHPALGLWKGDSRIVNKLTYDDMVDLQQELAATANLRLSVTGGVSVEEVQAALDGTFGNLRPRSPHGKNRRPALPAIESVGEVLPAFDELDCTITFTLPPVDDAVPKELSWAESRLVEACIEAQLAGRLRRELGLVYYVRSHVWTLAGEAMLEVETACLPKFAPRVRELLDRELAAATAVTATEVARGKLAVCGEVVMAAQNPESALLLLQEQAAFGPPPQDAITAVQDVSTRAVRDWIGRFLQGGAYAYSVIGPILEEDLESFEASPGSDDR